MAADNNNDDEEMKEAPSSNVEKAEVDNQDPDNINKVDNNKDGMDGSNPDTDNKNDDHSKGESDADKDDKEDSEDDDGDSEEDSDDEDAQEGDLVKPKKNDVVSTKLRSWVSSCLLPMSFCFLSFWGFLNCQDQSRKKMWDCEANQDHMTLTPFICHLSFVYPSMFTPFLK